MTDSRRDNVLLGSKGLVLGLEGGGSVRVWHQSLNVNIRRFRQLTSDSPLHGLGVGLYMLQCYRVRHNINGWTLFKLSMETQTTEECNGINWLIIQSKCVFLSTRQYTFTIHKCWQKESKPSHAKRHTWKAQLQLPSALILAPDGGQSKNSTYCLHMCNSLRTVCTVSISVTV
jgi:hypothetical protein